MAKIINTQYLESLLDEVCQEEANAIAVLLEERVKKGFRYVCICAGKREILDRNGRKVVFHLKKLGITLDDGEEGLYPFSCTCVDPSMGPCRCGYVFKF